MTSRPAVRTGVGSFLLFVLFAFSGCPDPTITVPQSAPESWADSLMQALTLEEKVGQMLMLDLPLSASVEEAPFRNGIRERLTRSGAGGVVLFAGEAIPTAQMVAWAQYVSSVPLLVALDAEWGAGYRLRGLTRLPDAMAFGATGKPARAYAAGRITAREAQSAGVSVLFAPTVDVNIQPANPVIGTRAYADQPDSVALYATAFAAGVAAEGVLPVLKHFPGHGSTTRDSHVDLPVAESDDPSFMRIHATPFKAVFDTVDTGVMTAHVIPRGHSFADSVAATFSRRIVTDLLRDSLHFEGLVFTDALNMAGAESAGSPGERAIRAIEAGADILLMPPDEGETRLAIIEAVRSGRLSRARIDSSATRILQTKQRLGLHEAHFGADAALFRTVDAPDNRREARYAAREAVTVLKDNLTLPLAVSDSVLLVSVEYRAARRQPGGPADVFRKALEDRSGHPVVHVEVDPRAWQASMRALLKQLPNYKRVLVADYNGNTPVFGWNPAAFLSDLAAAGASIIWIEFDRPWILPELEFGADALVQSWDGSTAMAEGTADVLFGLAPLSGRLPVDVGPVWPRGAGLSWPARFASPGRPSDADLDDSILSHLAFDLGRAVADSAFPAAALAIGRDMTVGYQELIGYHTFERMHPLQERDLFDMASLTKVVSTTSAVMILVDQGRIDLDRPVADYLPEFGQNGKGMVTVRQVLTHTGGLIPFRPFHMQGVRSGAEVRRRILSDSLAYEPGTQSRYSDFGPITLAWVIESITGQDFGRFVQEQVFGPLQMMDTGYLSNRTRNRPDAVPTEADDYFRNRTLQGEVHDETAWLLGGTAGHAGLFSTIRDMERFAGMLSRDGRIGDQQLIRPETLRRFTTAVDPSGSHTRALGWDTKSMTGYSSAGSRFGPRSFGHTGFTGTSLWYDPDSHLYVILLTNRVHPTRNNRRLTPIRPAMADAAFEALVRNRAAVATGTE